MVFPQSVLDIVSDVTKKFPDDIPAAVKEARRRIPEPVAKELFEAWLHETLEKLTFLEPLLLPYFRTKLQAAELSSQLQAAFDELVPEQPGVWRAVAELWDRTVARLQENINLKREMYRAFGLVPEDEGEMPEEESAAAL